MKWFLKLKLSGSNLRFIKSVLFKVNNELEKSSKICENFMFLFDKKSFNRNRNIYDIDIEVFIWSLTS